MVCSKSIVAKGAIAFSIVFDTFSPVPAWYVTSKFETELTVALNIEAW